jgi:hypothetical protein
MLLGKNVELTCCSSRLLCACLGWQSPLVQARTGADVRDRLLARFQTVVKPLLQAVKKDVFKGLAPLIDIHLVAKWVLASIVVSASLALR